MDQMLEIRKLQPSSLRELVQILEYNESWKQLMTIIPKTLNKDNFICNISSDNQPKYNSEHIKIIERASKSMHRDCAEILFDEWGTSGRIRPTLGHLLYLLVKAELFRAADYVAINLLRVAPPARPSIGPAALVSASLTEPTSDGIEVILNGIRYPSELSNFNNSSHTVNNEIIIPEIIVTEDNDRNSVERNNVEIQSSRIENISESVSDLIQFQSESTRNVTTTNDIPPISDLLHETNNIQNTESIENNEEYQSSESYQSDQFIPVLSGLNMSTRNGTQDLSPSIDINSNVPQISALLESSKSENESNLIPNLSILNNSGLSKSAEDMYNSRLSRSNDNIPNLSALNLHSTKSKSVHFENEFIPDLSALNATVSSKQENISIKENIINERSKNLLNSGSLPHLSSLLSDKSNSNISKSSLFIPSLDSESKSQTDSSNGASKGSIPSILSKNLNSSRRQCVSPLPNLSLNTKLPHFMYCQLENATNNFDETPHHLSCNIEEDLKESNGRFLGSGAFGSVFLAIGLLGRPVAVKKLFLNNEDIVNIDDPITKQFKNEVEVLSKYQHENLLSLVGYSCDGPTYCLLYEYIPGGALKDRLQTTEDRLMWTDRLYIAMGTARAISYLHTAYSTPLIHRDIKTANILLDCSNKPKLCDFGIIKLVPSQNTNTSTTVFGTSAYMAPEAFRGDISVKLDTFSFGVVLLELLTSLAPLDDNREGCDIVTHVEEICENKSIALLLDTKAGTWTAKDINFAEKLYAIAIKCLMEKKKRPHMVEIMKELSELIELT